jgi:hypothetical protein
LFQSIYERSELLCIFISDLGRILPPICVRSGPKVKIGAVLALGNTGARNLNLKPKITSIGIAKKDFNLLKYPV